VRWSQTNCSLLSRSREKSPKIHADNLLHHPRIRWRQIALTNLSDQRLTFRATQRHGSCWLLHDASFETQTIGWLSDQRDVTGACELVKPNEITTSLVYDGMRIWPHGADAALCPVEWGEQGKEWQAQTALTQGHLEASAWLE